MNVFYQNAWQEWGCVGAGLGVAAIVLLLLIPLLVVFFLLFRRANNRLAPEERPANARALRALFGVIAGILLVTLVATTHFSTILQRAAVSTTMVRLDYCDGLSARTETLFIGDLRSIEYREIWEDPHSPVRTDKLVLIARDGVEHFVPLNTHMDDARLRALHRIAPPSVMEDWRAALVYHNADAPDRVFAPDY